MEQRCDLLGEPRAVTQRASFNQVVVIVKVARRFGSGPFVAIDVCQGVKARGHVEYFLAQLRGIDEDELDGALCTMR